MYYPSLDDVKAAAGRGTVMPIYREVLADLETPVSAYLKIARGRYSFLLESVEGGERLARYSFMGTEPYRVLRGDAGLNGAGDPLRAVEEELKRFEVVPVDGLPRFAGGAVGFLGWECIRHYEPRVPVHAVDTLGTPEAEFMFADTLLVFDHLKHVIKVVSYVRLDGDVESSYRQAMWKIEELVDRLSRPLGSVPENGPAVAGAANRVASNIPREDYLMAVERAREYIVAGDAIQVVLSQRMRRRTTAHPFNIYRGLRHVNPSPFMFYLDFGDYQIAGASPELLVRVEDGHLDYHPIAGTRPRGRTEEEDQTNEAELRASEKERAEHIMLVDLGRNDVGRVSTPGTVQVTDLMSVERYSHVMHLVSHVTGRLREDLTPFDAVRACFPAGTVSGAPKIRAMEIIGELEPDQRGPYAGCVGYFGFEGNLDTCITIRTLLIKDGVAYIQAGGGVVFDSDPAEEYQETINKARASLRAIEDAERAGGGRRPGSLGY
ncbi:MAG: anthranilate synthase component I [Dehalococcoidia bacterium]